ncbi:MAG TPA: hypothetical protein VLH09_02060 [Bryobacteraceae bacterium]|nr:hypothetical protein [Bryobacteraceae bacterium]
MANQGKHSRNPVSEWMEGEEGNTPTKSRGSHVVDSYVKKSKPTLKKARKAAVAVAVPKPEPALMREPAPRTKPEVKPSQAASWEHQRKVERLSQLRAPYSYRNR